MDTGPSVDDAGAGGRSKSQAVGGSMEQEEQAALLNPAAAEEPHPRPPPTRSSFYGTLELFEEDAGLLDDGAGEGWRHRLCHCLTVTVIRTCAVLIAVFICVCDNLPYGLLIFPPAWNLSPLGVQMVLVSAVAAQLSYGAMSSFTCALGSFIIENVAFLRAMSTSISAQLRAEDRLDEAFMTILFCFSLSTILTGAAFWALGKLQLGRISSFFPQHVLNGVIAGMGVFILVEGVGITTGVDWSWEPSVLLQQLAPGPFCKVAVTALLTGGLSALKTRFHHPIVTPIYFFVIPAVFFFVLHAFRIPLATARASGWLFSFEAASGSDAMPEPTPSSGIGVAYECHSFPGVLACLDPRRIAWDMVPTQLFTILGLIFFSIIHVPVNVPALSVTTGVDADLNLELKAHGVSNLLSGLLGGLQNYMAYSMSALYYKTGGEGRFCSFLVAGLLAGFMMLGPRAINYFPRPLAGCLLMHLGAVLLYESLVETWHKAVDLSEYLTIWLISLAMTAIGFMEGLGIGLLVACGIFVVQCSRINPIGASFPGDGLSSKEMRSATQRKMLDYRLQGTIYIIKIRGNLFFGNVEQLWLHVREVLVRMPNLKFLLVDTSEMVGVDFSARERLARICKSVTGRRVHIVWAGLSKRLRHKLKLGGVFDPPPLPPNSSLAKRGSSHINLGARAAPSPTHHSEAGGSGSGSFSGSAEGPAATSNSRFHHFAKDLNKAFTFCEDAVLESLGAQDREGPSPRGTGFLHRTLKKLTSERDDIIARIVPFFTREIVPAGTTLWRRNDPSSFACIVEKGLLGIPRSPHDPSVSASLAQAPANVRAGGGAAAAGWPYRNTPSAPSPLPSHHQHAPQPAPPTAPIADPVAAAAAAAEVEAHHPLFSHVEPDSLSYSMGRSLSSGGGGGIGGGPVAGGGAAAGSGQGDFVEYSLPGQMSGELGLFTRELRRYTMVALAPESVIWRIDVATLNAMLTQDPQAYIVLQRMALSYASHRLHCLVFHGQLHSV